MSFTKPITSSKPAVLTKQPQPPIWAVIPASGVGSRMQSDVPKQYLTLNGLTVMEQTLHKIHAVHAVVGIVLVVSKADQYYQALDFKKFKNVHIVEGGATRAESVLQGLQFVKRYITQQGVSNEYGLHKSPFDLDKTWVLVHDCARPCVKGDDIQRLIETCLAQDVGGILAEKVTDTVKESSVSTAQASRVINTKDRSALWLAQTPQFFKLTALIHALSMALDTNVKQRVVITDEASAIEEQGGEVLLIPSPKTNIKITQPSDLALAQAILKM